ncbi:hypothetical protein [Fibrella aquatilis]|uniref:Uncharacterized protein n=1 Tax=Fibrella aquatilis TaxID=2817059 RepID=A0A939GAS9_9BACT|nr:hypothetical protein [Fibrella aquatilis]MBO0933824.1 hypothetical protein [Fibrella aquatilis]
MSLTVYEEEYQGIRQFVQQLFPHSDQLELVVPGDQQVAELERLRLGRRPEQFAIITNLLDLSVEHAIGMSELGYADNTFSFRQYLRCMPNPGVMRNSILLSKELFRIVVDALPAIYFLRPRFMVNLPLRHANGEVLLVKRILSPWQLTTTGQITAYLSEFHIIKPYEGEPLSPRFYDVPEAVRERFYEAVYRLFASLSAKKNPFTPRELVLLRTYLSLAGPQRPSARQLAKKMGISELMVKEYNKSVLVKAKGLFGDDLPVTTAYDVAMFLLKTGLLLPGSA